MHQEFLMGFEFQFLIDIENSGN